MIGKLEKLETCIRLADKMDNMDRTWRWFINPFFRMCNSKVKDLFGFWNDVNETYPDSMGEYQLAAEIRGYDWYRHKDRKNEFLLYATGKFRIVMRISCKVVYYLVIAMVAYITTRDQGDFFAESDLSNMETHVTPSFRYKLVWAFVVFGVLIM